MRAQTRTDAALGRMSPLSRPLSFWPASLLPACCAVACQATPGSAEETQMLLAEVCKLWSMTNPHNLEFFMKSVMARNNQKLDLLKKLEVAIEQISRCELAEGLRSNQDSDQKLATDSVESFQLMLERNRRRMVGFGEQDSTLFRGVTLRSSEAAGSDLLTPPASARTSTPRKFAPIKVAFNWQQHEFGAADTAQQRKERVKTPFDLSSITGVWVKDVESSDKTDTNPGFCEKNWAKHIARMNASALKMDIGLEHYEHSYRTFGFFHSTEKYFWDGNDCDASSPTCDHEIHIKLTSAGWTKRITWPGSPDQELRETYSVSLDGQTLLATSTIRADGETLIRRNVYKRQRGGWFGRL